MRKFLMLLVMSAAVAVATVATPTPAAATGSSGWGYEDTTGNTRPHKVTTDTSDDSSVSWVDMAWAYFFI